MDAAQLRSEYPIFERVAYLNAGTNGPISQPFADAVRAELELEARGGRSGSRHWARLDELATELRSRLASLMGTGPDQLALTRSTTDGAEAVLTGFPLDADSVILTSDEEHAGLLGPLAGARARTGARIEQAPFAELHEHIDSRTSLVAISHVSWMTGSVAPLEQLVAAGAPLLIDGAQALGARPIDVDAIDCAFYAASGQKWLCGPSGTGALFVARDWLERLGVPHPRYMTLDERSDPLERKPRAGARRFDSGELAGPDGAALLASLELLERFGWESVYEHSSVLAAELRKALAGRVALIPGGADNLVVFDVGSDAASVVARLEQAGVIVRAIPDRPWVRASLGPWNSSDDVERLVAAL